MYRLTRSRLEELRDYILETKITTHKQASEFQLHISQQLNNIMYADAQIQAGRIQDKPRVRSK